MGRPGHASTDRDGGGARVPGSRWPALGALTGDLAGLATLFQPTPLPADQGWRLQLAPKVPDIASTISEVEIAGDRFIKEVVIREAAGDRTAIAFDDFRTEPQTLEASEQAYFEN